MARSAGYAITRTSRPGSAAMNAAKSSPVPSRPGNNTSVVIGVHDGLRGTAKQTRQRGCKLPHHMKILITGSSGHLGEALMRTLADGPHEALGVDLLRSPFTNVVGSIADRAVVDACMHGVDAVLHTATLHKPHVSTHRRQDFIDTNITGTLNLLEAAVANRVRSFVFTSTTSAFGDTLTPPRGEPAAWITEGVVPIPKNIYGAT